MDGLLKFGQNLLGGAFNGVKDMFTKPLIHSVRYNEVQNPIRIQKNDNVAAQTPLPSPTPPPQFGQNLSNNFRFAYENLPRDQYYATTPITNSGGKNRPNFTPQQPPEFIGNLIRKHFPNEATMAAVVAATENGEFNPTRFDNVNPSDGSADRGIMQINSNRFNGLMQKHPELLNAYGIDSFDDLYDADKNLYTAKVIRDLGRQGSPDTNSSGFKEWFGWQSTGYDLNKGWFTQPNRAEYAEQKKQERLKKGKR